MKRLLEEQDLKGWLECGDPKTWGDISPEDLEDIKRVCEEEFNKDFSELYTIDTECLPHFNIVKLFKRDTKKVELDGYGLEGYPLYRFSILGHKVVGEVMDDITSYIICDRTF